MKFKILILVVGLLFCAAYAGVHSQKAKGSATEQVIENQDVDLGFCGDVILTPEMKVVAPVVEADNTVYLAYNELVPDLSATSINDPPDLIGIIGQKIALYNLRC